MKHLATDILAVITPTVADAGVSSAANLDHYSAFAMHAVAIVCTILITHRKFRKKSKENHHDKT